MANYLFAVQDNTGREVLSKYHEVDKVSTISAVATGGSVDLVADGDPIATAEDPGGDLWLYRWPADDKLGTPVKHKVSRVE